MRDAVDTASGLANTGPDGRTLIRELSANAGHRGNSSLDLTVGVGRASRADVTLHWPSGIQQKLKNVRLRGMRTCFDVVETADASTSVSRNLRKGILSRCRVLDRDDDDDDDGGDDDDDD